MAEADDDFCLRYTAVETPDSLPIQVSRLSLAPSITPATETRRRGPPSITPATNTCRRGPPSITPATKTCCRGPPSPRLWVEISLIEEVTAGVSCRYFQFGALILR